MTARQVVNSWKGRGRDWPFPTALLLPEHRLGPKGSWSACGPAAGGRARAAHRTPSWSRHWAACRTTAVPDAKCQGDSRASPPPPRPQSPWWGPSCAWGLHMLPAFPLAQPGLLPFSEAHFDGPQRGAWPPSDPSASKPWALTFLGRMSLTCSLATAAHTHPGTAQGSLWGPAALAGAAVSMCRCHPCV